MGGIKADNFTVAYDKTKKEFYETYGSMSELAYKDIEKRINENTDLCDEIEKRMEYRQKNRFLAVEQDDELAFPILMK